MEQIDLNDIQRQLNEIRKSLKSDISEIRKVERIDYSLFNIQRLLDPRPPVSANNFCSNCGHKLNNNISGFDTDGNLLNRP